MVAKFVAGWWILCVTTTPSAAEVLTGGAALAKVRDWCEGKKLDLRFPGDSAVRDFVVTMHDLDSRFVAQMASLDGRMLLVARRGQQLLPISVCGVDWTWLLSGDDPGSYLYVPGTQNSFRLRYGTSGGEVTMNFAGVTPDPSFTIASGCDFTDLLPSELAADDEWKLEPADGNWLLSGRRADDGKVLMVRLEPEKAWPLREILVRTKNGGASVVIQTGDEVPDAWRRVTVEALFALGPPVRTMQTSPVQWKKRESTKFFTEPEGMAMIQKFVAPLLKCMSGVIGNGGAEATDVTVAREALHRLIPPPDPNVLEPGSEVPEKVESSGDSTWKNLSLPLPQDGKPVTVPLEFANGIPMVNVRIGAKEHRLCLDTGSEFSAIVASAVSPEWSFNRPLEQTHHDLHSQNQEVELRRVPEMRIGAWHLQQAVFSVQRSSYTTEDVTTDDGRLGVDILRLHPFTIDWPRGTLTFHPRDTFSPPGDAVESVLGRFRTLSTIRATLAGVGELQPILDTGFTGMLTVPEAFAKSHAEAFGSLRNVRSSLQAPSGWITQRMFLWPAGRPLEAAGRREDGGFGIFEIPDSSGFGVGFLGAAFFADARVTFDLESGRVWVSRQQRQPVADRIANGWDMEARDASGYTALGRALLAGNLRECEALAAAGASFDVSEEWGAMTPAVGSGNPAAVEWVAARDPEGRWRKSDALIQAIHAGSPEIARWLLEHGIERAANRDAMRAAAAAGDVATARLLHEKGYPFVWNEGAGENRHAAHQAIASEHPDFLQWLLEVDGAAMRNVGSQPLVIFAAGITDPACLKMLLAAGFDPLARNSKGATALHAAASEGRNEALKLLLPKTNSVDLVGNEPYLTPLMLAVRYGQSEAVGLLLAAGANPEGPDGHGLPLWMAASQLERASGPQAAPLALRGDPGGTPPSDGPGCVRRLIAAGAMPTRRVASTCAAEILAAHGLELARLCLDHGATPRNAPGMLNAAAGSDRGEVVALLLSKGWDPDFSPGGEDLPLEVALKKGATGVVKALVEGGVDVRTTLPGGTLPLNAASMHNDVYLIRLLVKAGANPAEDDLSGLTPLYTAIDWRCFGAARALVKAGADPKRKVGVFTPLEFARRLDVKYPELERFLEEESAREGAGPSGRSR